MNANPVFSAILAVVKRWLPEETKKKLFFFSGEGIPEELLRYVHPPAIVALYRVLENEYGDTVAKELKEGPPSKWKRQVEKQVGARHTLQLYFSLADTSTKSIHWKHKNAQESPKSTVWASLLYVKKEHEQHVPPADVQVHRLDIKDDTSASLPSDAVQALVVLHLDQRSSWVYGHTFSVEVVGA